MLLGIEPRILVLAPLAEECSSSSGHCEERHRRMPMRVSSHPAPMSLPGEWHWRRAAIGKTICRTRVIPDRPISPTPHFWCVWALLAVSTPIFRLAMSWLATDTSNAIPAIVRNEAAAAFSRRSRLSGDAAPPGYSATGFQSRLRHHREW